MLLKDKMGLKMKNEMGEGGGGEVGGGGGSRKTNIEWGLSNKGDWTVFFVLFFYWTIFFMVFQRKMKFNPGPKNKLKRKFSVEILTKLIILRYILIKL